MHVLIVGQTFSGKTHLAKAMARDCISKGENVIVFDPRKDGGWPPQAKCYKTPAGFINAYWETENVHAFIDEARNIFDFDQREGEKMMLEGRHGGRINYVIGQRAIGLIPPAARTQCAHVFAFRQKPADAKLLAEDFDDGVMRSVKKPKINFVYSDPYRSMDGRLTFNKFGEASIVYEN